jgi:peptidoglycan/LPS O-acetylase OafA/YrhL
LQREIRSHTGLRGIAALLVVAYHLQFNPGYKFPFETATALFSRSYLMVDLFFILSGFVLSYVYRGDRRLTPAERKSFWVARFARIYPLHVFALAYLTGFVLATTALLALNGKLHEPLGSPFDWLGQLLLLNAWFPATNLWNIPSWSISAESFAYFLFPFLTAVHARSRTTTQLILLTAAVAFYLFVVASGGSLDITEGLAPLRCIAGFGLGMLLFWYSDVIEGRSVATLSLLQLIATAWIFFALMVRVSDPIIVPAFALIVISTWQDRGIVARMLSTRPLHWLGDVSYSIYLMHVPVGSTLWFLWIRLEPKLGLAPAISRGTWLCLLFAVLLPVTALTRRFVERPCQQAVRRWSRGRHMVDAAAVAAP